MRKRALVAILGLLVLLLGAMLLLPLGIAFLFDSRAEIPAFLWSIGVCVVVGGAASLSCAGCHRELGSREAFAVVGLGWTVISAFAALPFVLAPGGIPSYLDAYFETMSGLTTTGASVLADIESLPRGLLFWRSMTHWLGGMGIVVLTVAILPFLGAGGTHLLRAELTGPTADKLAPRIAQTAGILWLVYILLTVAQILLLWPAMGLFDAACHAFGTLSSGGYSTKNASIAHYDSLYVDTVVTVFMLLGGANFLLHYRALAGKGLPHLRDSEFRFYAGLFAVATVTIAVFLRWGDFPDLERNPAKYDSTGQCFRYAAFQVGSVMTTTGFATADFDRWPNVCRAILLLLMVIGGCAGSTSGAVKCIRVLTLLRYGLREIHRLVRPHAVIPLRIGGQPIDREVVARVMGFLALYGVVLVIAVLLLTMILGADSADGRAREGSARSIDAENSALLTAFGATVSCLGNVGPGLGGVGPLGNYGHVPAEGKVLLIFLMLIGRLEIYAVLVLFVPMTWRR